MQTPKPQPINPTQSQNIQYIKQRKTSLLITKQSYNKMKRPNYAQSILITYDDSYVFVSEFQRLDHVMSNGQIINQLEFKESVIKAEAISSTMVIILVQPFSRNIQNKLLISLKLLVIIKIMSQSINKQSINQLKIRFQRQLSVLSKKMRLSKLGQRIQVGKVLKSDSQSIKIQINQEKKPLEDKEEIEEVGVIESQVTGLSVLTAQTVEVHQQKGYCIYMSKCKYVYHGLCRRKHLYKEKVHADVDWTRRIVELQNKLKIMNQEIMIKNKQIIRLSRELSFKQRQRELEMESKKQKWKEKQKQEQKVEKQASYWNKWEAKIKKVAEQQKEESYQDQDQYDQDDEVDDWIQDPYSTQEQRYQLEKYMQQLKQWKNKNNRK